MPNCNTKMTMWFNETCKFTLSAFVPISEAMWEAHKKSIWNLISNERKQFYNIAHFASHVRQTNNRVGCNFSRKMQTQLRVSSGWQKRKSRQIVCALNWMAVVSFFHCLSWKWVWTNRRGWEWSGGSLLLGFLNKNGPNNKHWILKNGGENKDADEWKMIHRMVYSINSIDLDISWKITRRNCWQNLTSLSRNWIYSELMLPTVSINIFIYRLSWKQSPYSFWFTANCNPKHFPDSVGRTFHCK